MNTAAKMANRTDLMGCTEEKLVIVLETSENTAD